jgi:cathepsin B
MIIKSIIMYKLLVILALTTVVLSKNFKNEKPFVTKEFSLQHQNHPFETYSFEEHPFRNYTLKQIKKLLGLKTLPPNQAAPLGNTSLALPASFNASAQWPECIHEIRDQGHCGSCWAHAASEVLSDRFCIASNGSINNVLSVQEMVSCDYLDMGCNGGILTFSWIYLRFFGIATDSCKPYKSGNGDVPSCPLFKSECEDGSVYRKYKARNFYYLFTVNSIKENLLKNGPVETGFTVYDDFINYKSGVYSRQSSNVLGGHAVKIIGWGVENGVEHWIVANSWGYGWGENGFFRIAFGECGIDGSVIAGDPSL